MEVLDIHQLIGGVTKYDKKGGSGGEETEKLV